LNLFRRNKEILTPEEKKERNRNRMLLIISGILMGLSFPPFPFPFQLLMFAGLVPLLMVIEKKERLLDINRAVYLFGFVFSLITLYWVGSWQKEADPFLMISGILLVFVNPVFFMIPSTLLYYSRKIIPSGWALYLFPFYWITYEYLYMLTDASFPWLILGGGLSKFTSYIQIADVIGTLGLSLFVVYINVFLYKAWFNFRLNSTEYAAAVTGAVLLFIIPVIYGYYTFSSFSLSDKKIKVGIIQPNINPWDKWAGGNLNDLTQLHLDLSKKAVDNGARLLIWPETALPVYLFGGSYPHIVKQIDDFLLKEDVYLLTGMPHVIFYNKDDSIPDDAKYSESSGYYYRTYNAILLIEPGTGIIQQYGKMKLVPFGERVPFVDLFPFLGDLIKWGVGLGGWNVGRDTTIFKAAYNEYEDTVKINALVCYESIYPYFISQFIQKEAELITIVTNDSWYGNSSGPYQHKEFAVLRGVENRKSVIRAANGGISTIIDPLGRTVVETEMFTRDIINGEVVLQSGTTFFTRNSSIIPSLASFLSVITIVIFLIRKFKNFMKK
jgi:apolipoprotein N-acyltransferase